MAIKNLEIRLKKLEGYLEPDIVNVPYDKREVTKIDEGWKVFHLTFDMEKEAISFSKRLKEKGFEAYLDEIERQLLSMEKGE